MKSVPAALRYLGVVVLQYALENAMQMPENPVHALLLQHPLFQLLGECVISRATTQGACVRITSV